MHPPGGQSVSAPCVWMSFCTQQIVHAVNFWKNCAKDAPRFCSADLPLDSHFYAFAASRWSFRSALGRNRQEAEVFPNVSQDQTRCS